MPSLKARREYCDNEMKTIYPEVRRITNPHIYYVDLSEKLLINASRCFRENLSFVQLIVITGSCIEANTKILFVPISCFQILF